MRTSTPRAVCPAQPDTRARSASSASASAAPSRTGWQGPCADLSAAVPFYGSAPPLDNVGAIKAELMLHFAANNERVNAGSWPPFEAALKAAGVKHTAHVYPNTQHGFHNDTTPRYDAEAAQLAWGRTLELFNRVLRG